MNHTIISLQGMRKDGPAAEVVEAVGPVVEPAQRCSVCGKELQPVRLTPYQPTYRCPRCGLMEAPAGGEATSAARMVHYFRAVDPHAAVAASKAGFYSAALDYLGSCIRREPRALLDVGCGFGYFLERAAAAGWQPWGVDVVPEAVTAARKRVPSAQVFAMDVCGAGLATGSLDAVTLWDVLDMVPDPAAVLDECLRLLSPGGIIGIRIRNLNGQLWLYRGYTWMGRFWSKGGVLPPFVFHRRTFTRRSIEYLLSRTGFCNIVSRHSPLTKGDPYSFSRVRGMASVGKAGVVLLSGLIRGLSAGRILVGPSLLVWAQKKNRIGSRLTHLPS